MGAPTFKECLAADLPTFLNPDEFADIHTINGKEMTVMVDENELLERDKSKLLGAPTGGLYKSRRLIYVFRLEFGPRPANGTMLNLDGRQFKIVQSTEEAGILAIELEAVRS